MTKAPMSHPDHIPPDDINELFTAVHLHAGAVAGTLATALTLHLCTGLRPAEVAALKHGDTDQRG